VCDLVGALWETKYWLAASDMGKEGGYEWCHANSKPTKVDLLPVWNVTNTSEENDCLQFAYDVKSGALQMLAASCEERALHVCTVITKKCLAHFLYKLLYLLDLYIKLFLLLFNDKCALKFVFPGAQPIPEHVF